MTKRYFPIIRDEKELIGVELEGPYGTVDASYYHGSDHVSMAKARIDAREMVQTKVQGDDRFKDGDYVLKVIREWSSNNSNSQYNIECHVYKIKGSDKGKDYSFKIEK